MGISRFERLLAGAAAIAIVAATAPAAYAGPDTPDAIEAAVPVPTPADIAPLTPADVGVTATPEAPKVAAPAPAAETPNAAAAPVVDAPKAAEAAPPAPATATDLAAAKIKELLTAKSDRIFSAKKDRAGAETFYAARNNAPVWIADGAPTDKAKALAAALGAADTEGLDPTDYPAPYLKAGMDPDAAAEADLKLTAAALTYARHLQIGRVHYSRVSPDIFYALDAAEPADVLAKLAGASDVADALDGYAPTHPQYIALKKKLAEARAAKGATVTRIAGGPALKFDAKKPLQDARVPALRARLGVSGNDSDLTYDKPLADAVAGFQKNHGMKASGQFNAATLDALNGPKRDRDADIIIANMERWRWMPHDLGKNRVILNIPDYTLHVYSGDAQVWQTRVVVGKPGEHATPLLTETMKYITVNPTWNVPPSIVYKEYLPALQQDPTVLDRMGLRLVQSRDGGIHISQPPGERNALGRIRFNFPNKFLVYQHDTPDKNLFALDKRAYSHGCMRVQDPAKYAEVLLGLSNPQDNYTQQRIKSMYGTAEVDIKLNTPIPVHITYQTAFVDDAGNLQIRDDVYGRDARLLAILKGDERKIGEVAMEHSQPNYARPSVTLPYGVSGAQNSATYNNGPGFFEMLFGGNRQPAPPARVNSRRTAAR